MSPGSATRWPARAPRNGRAPSGERSSTIHQRAVQLEVGRGGGEAQLDALAARERAGHGGGQRRGDVDDEQVARAQVIGQVAEAGVLDRAGRALGDEQPHLVAGEPARLGRLGRLERARELERGRVHATAPASSAAR